VFQIFVGVEFDPAKLGNGLVFHSSTHNGQSLNGWLCP
jgi:hypothetical protein